MNLSHEEIQKARRISRAIQQFLTETGMRDARTPDVYEYLARRGLVEKDRHGGLHFRNFLRKLKDAGMMKLIPQCTYLQSASGANEWHFYLASEKRAELGDIRVAGHVPDMVIAPQATEEEVLRIMEEERPRVVRLPGRDVSGFTPQQLELRSYYPRAYEYWTEEEREIMVRVFALTGNVDKVAGLLCRQPHVVAEKLEEMGERKPVDVMVRRRVEGLK